MLRLESCKPEQAGGQYTIFRPEVCHLIWESETSPMWQIVQLFTGLHLKRESVLGAANPDVDSSFDEWPGRSAGGPVVAA